MKKETFAENKFEEWLTKVNAELTQDLSKQEREILLFIFKNKKITSENCQKLLNISRVMANRSFNRLIKKRLIERRGTGKYVYYDFLIKNVEKDRKK